MDYFFASKEAELDAEAELGDDHAADDEGRE